MKRHVTSEVLAPAPQITSEVHRELDASRNRGEKAADAPATQAAQKGGATGENPRDLPPVVLMEED